MQINLPEDIVESIVIRHLKRMFEIELYRTDEGGYAIEDTEVIEAYLIVIKEHLTEKEYENYFQLLKEQK